MVISSPDMRLMRPSRVWAIFEDDAGSAVQDAEEKAGVEIGRLRFHQADAHVDPGLRRAAMLCRRPGGWHPGWR